MPSGPEGGHLFIILNDPMVIDTYGPRAHVLLVNLSTVRQGISCDETCVLAASCHPFVKHESYVVYARARIDPAEHLQRLVRQGVFKPQEPMPADILTQIRAGLKTSPFTKREFKQLNI